jgi:hypothetical protein
MARQWQPVTRVSILDLLDANGRFKRPEDLPKKVRYELQSYSVDAEGRLKRVTFRDRYARYRAPWRAGKRKKPTKAMQREIDRRLRLLDEELARRLVARYGAA